MEAQVSNIFLSVWN